MNVPSPGRMHKCPICAHVSPVLIDKATDYAYCPVCLFPIRKDSSVPLGDATFPKFLGLCKKRMIAVFWAPWAPGARDFIPLFDITARAFQDKTIFVSIDISDNPEMNRFYGIEILPTVLVFEYGREINRLLGAVSAFDLERLASV